jgi:hypothetical protein
MTGLAMTPRSSRMQTSSPGPFFSDQRDRLQLSGELANDHVTAALPLHELGGSH